MKKFKLVALLLFSCIWSFAQDKNTSKLKFKLYIDSYYASFSDDLSQSSLQAFTTVSPRDQQFSINVAQFGLHYEGKDVRSNLTVHYGDIAKATWSSRFPNIQEANVGVHLFPNWWLDIGFFTTHIGTESFLPKNNYLSSTAVLTYNEPFYQAGAKLAYEGSEKYDVEFWITNGYNFFQDVNKDKSFGLLFNYNISKNSSITYTNLSGNEQAIDDEVKKFRSYHNLYFNSSIKNMILLTLGVDYGWQTNTISNTETATMFGGVATIRFKWTEKLSTTLRQEIFQDEAGFISGPVATIDMIPEGLQLQGTTLGVEYKPTNNSYLRAETRRLQSLSENAILFANDTPRTRWESMITVGYYID